MYEHVDRSYTLKNSQFTKGNNDFSRPFNNIILPIANVNYRSEGFDVKDVQIYVNDKSNYHKSFLTRKYHDRWAKKFSIDTAIDESVESYYDYGLTLVKNVNSERPEIIQLQQLAFCDQTDILSGPICLKHQYTIDQLLDMGGKWDPEAVDRAVMKSRFSQQRVNDKETKTPGRYIEVYELHGVFPDAWLTDGMENDEGTYSRQMHIVTYYVDSETNQKNGITLFKGKLEKPIFKALKRDNIYGRACGRGGIEELFHPQIWTNYSEIHMQQMLEAVSKVVLKSTDPKVAKNNNLRNLKHNQVITLSDGKDINQLAIQAPNKNAFDNYVNKWEQRASALGSASDPQLGKNPVSGTPLGTTEIVVGQGQGIHEYRQGKISVFWAEIYRDWVIGYLTKEMLKGDEWLDELEVDELKEIADIVVTKEANKKIKDAVFKGELVTKEDQENYKTLIREEFEKGGKKRFLKLVEDEIKDIPLDVEFNFSGKQKNLAEVVSKLNSVFRTLFANPQILENEGMADLFNQIIESAGLSPIHFSGFKLDDNVPEETEQPVPQAPDLALTQ